MRDFKGMKRQRGRNRGGGNTGGGQKPTHNVNRAFDSNGPDGVKIRGAAQHVFEKYQQLARDATASGDRVLGENYLQHAEHYFRLIRAVQPMKPASEIIGRDTFSGYDIDFEDESGQRQQEAADSQDSAEAGAEPPVEGVREPRTEYRAEARDNSQRQEWRRDRDGRPDGPRDDRPRDDRPREDRAARNRDRDRDRPDRVEPVSEAAPPAEAASDDFQLRSHDGGLSPAPAFLQPRADLRPDGEDEVDAKRPRAPRRRRAPRGFEGGDEGSSSPPKADDA